VKGGTEAGCTASTSKRQEVASIECQNPLDSVHRHCGNQSCVVYFATQDMVHDDKALPLAIGRRGIGQKSQGLLDFFDLGERNRHSKAQTVVCRRPGGDIPEFRNVLRG